MVKSPNFYYRSVDRHGLHVIGGPLLVGGAQFLLMRTRLGDDWPLHQILDSDERFRAYLRFRDEAFQIAASQMFSPSYSPVDYFGLTEQDEKEFLHQYLLNLVIFRRTGLHVITMDDQSNENEVDNISTAHYLSRDPSITYYQNTKSSILDALDSTRRYFAYRKGLVKLDFIQPSSDPEEAIKRIKSLTGWSELGDNELRKCLQSHMDLLKEHEMIKQESTCRSICEYKSVALEKINLELSSSLADCLCDYDWMLMDIYYKRMRLRNVARECATQAQNAGVILVEKALPLRVHLEEEILAAVPKVRMWPIMKQNVKQALDGCMGTLQHINGRFGSGGAPSKIWQLIAFGTLASVATGTVGKR